MSLVHSRTVPAARKESESPSYLHLKSISELGKTLVISATLLSERLIHLYNPGAQGMFAEMGNINLPLQFTEEEAEASNLTVLFWEIPRLHNPAFLTPMLEILISPEQSWVTQDRVL